MSGVFHRNRAESRRYAINEDIARTTAADEAKRLSDIEKQNAEARKASGERVRGGAASTILTSGEGDPMDPKSARKTLLGI